MKYCRFQARLRGVAVKRSMTSQQGFALLSAILSVAFLSVVVILFSRGLARSMKTRVAVEIKEQYQTIESAVTNDMLKLVSELSPTSCLEVKALIQGSLDYEAEHDPDHSFTNKQQIPFEEDEISDPNQDEKIKMEKRQFTDDENRGHDERKGRVRKMKSKALIAALDRCDQPKFISSEKIDDQNQSHLYFCLNIEEPVAVGKTKESEQALIEVAIDFEKTSDNSSASCFDFLHDRSAIARITYGIYFVNQEGDRESSKRFGTFMAKSPAREY